jgi:hypothetical protein
LHLLRLQVLLHLHRWTTRNDAAGLPSAADATIPPSYRPTINSLSSDVGSGRVGAMPLGSSSSSAWVSGALEIRIKP